MKRETYKNDWYITLYGEKNYLEVSIGDDYELFFEVGNMHTLSGPSDNITVLLSDEQVDEMLQQIEIWRDERDKGYGQNKETARPGNSRDELG